MQQKLCSRRSSSFQLLERNGQAHGAGASAPLEVPPGLPFRCPRCGGDRQGSFPGLACLRAHLEHRHSYRATSDDLEPVAGGFSITGKHPRVRSSSSSSSYAAAAGAAVAAVAVPRSDMSLPSHRGQQSARRALHVRSLSDSRDGGYLPLYGCERRRTQSVGVATQTQTQGECGDDDDVEEGCWGRNEENIKKLFTKKSEPGHQHLHLPPPTPLEPPPDPDLGVSLEAVGRLEATAAVRRQLASLLRTADGSVQRRLARLSWEVARADTELLSERANSCLLERERQEVADRERSLSRQVDVAVMVIAALREELSASENELERREREVLTIQRFLEAAARQETCGKVRIQRFIENLLRRIALAERLVQYYQGNDGGPPHCNSHKQQQSDSGPQLITKSRSVGTQLCSSGVHDDRSHSPSPSSSSSQHGGCPLFCRTSRERDRDHRDHQERVAPAARLFCRPEHRDNMWNQQRRSAGYEA